MANLLVDPRDQKFVLYDMLHAHELCETELFGHLSKNAFDMSLDAARKLGVEEFYPAILESDRQGCGFKDGEVSLPSCFKKLKEAYDEGQWPGLLSGLDAGGQGFPMTLWMATAEYFMPNGSFMWLMNKPFSGTTIIEMFGSEEQKKRYLPDMVAGKWGYAISVNDDDSGCDVTMQTAAAVASSNGSYLIKGVKGHITGADMDLFDNIIHIVLARIEGDPLDRPSLFIVPKYAIEADGKPGAKNDIAIAELQDKMGFRGTPTCRVVYGENGDCRAELLGEPGQAMAMVLPMLFNGYACCGIQATAAASSAYRHALEYAKNRRQGAALQNADDSKAPRVPIVSHPDVRRMLLWMKSQTEGMRMLQYFTGICSDRARAMGNADATDKWRAMRDMLLPLCRIYTADAAFEVCETSIQVHGRYGYFKDSFVEQFLRDVKAQSIWELTTGIHSLMYVAQIMPQNDGRDFGALLGFMKETVSSYDTEEAVSDLAAMAKKGVDALASMAVYFGECAQTDRLLVPVANAVPFLKGTGTVVLGWLLSWQAAVAHEKLAVLCSNKGVDSKDPEQSRQLIGDNKTAAYLDGKIHGARYFLNNVLPQAHALFEAVKKEDLSIMSIADDGF